MTYKFRSDGPPKPADPVPHLCRCGAWGMLALAIEGYEAREAAA